MQIFQRTTWIIYGILIGISVAGSQPQWQPKSPMPGARQGMAAAVLGDNIYVIGGSQVEHQGLNIVQAYDTQQDTWETNIAPLNSARTNAAAVSLNGEIYVFGGRDHNQLIAAVERYDPVANQWSTISQLPTLREGLAAVVVDSLIWLIGGASFQVNYAIIERYNPSQNSWDTLIHQLTVPRVAPVAAVIDEEVYVFCGFYFGPLNSYEKYVAGQGWMNLGTMMYACGSAGGAAINGQIWIVGGENQSGILTNVQYQDFSNPGIWNNGPPLQTRRKNLSVAGVGNTLYAIGGRSGHHMGGLTNAVEALEVITGIAVLPDGNTSDTFELGQNYPNPFNGSTYFEVYLAKPGEAQIGVVDISGQRVRLLHQGRLTGRYRVEFDGRDDFGRTLPSGAYFIYLSAFGQQQVIKTTILK
jgi:N-acetylneuraminic acid mutarotase